MIIKIMQNLENKMELQINRPEARIGKIQETFNKNLEEIKNQQTETAIQLLKSKILQKKSVADKLRQKKG